MLIIKLNYSANLKLQPCQGSQKNERLALLPLGKCPSQVVQVYWPSGLRRKGCKFGAKRSLWLLSHSLSSPLSLNGTVLLNCEGMLTNCKEGEGGGWLLAMDQLVIQEGTVRFVCLFFYADDTAQQQSGTNRLVRLPPRVTKIQIGVWNKAPSDF